MVCFNLPAVDVQLTMDLCWKKLKRIAKPNPHITDDLFVLVERALARKSFSFAIVF